MFSRSSMRSSTRSCCRRCISRDAHPHGEEAPALTAMMLAIEKTPDTRRLYKSISGLTQKSKSLIISTMPLYASASDCAAPPASLRIMSALKDAGVKMMPTTISVIMGNSNVQSTVVQQKHDPKTSVNSVRISLMIMFVTAEKE